jgi:putative endonuclease
MLLRALGGLLALLGRADLGKRGESAAARHLRKQGLRIIARNFRARSGEIDIVAIEGQTLVFVEVKSSLDAGRGDPLQRINRAKARRIRRAAALCRKLAGREFPAIRIDGVAVDFIRGRWGRAAVGNVRWYRALYEVES